MTRRPSPTPTRIDHGHSPASATPIRQSWMHSMAATLMSSHRDGRGWRRFDRAFHDARPSEDRASTLEAFILRVVRKGKSDSGQFNATSGSRQGGTTEGGSPEPD